MPHIGATANPDPERDSTVITNVGQLYCGRYRIIKELGSGGFASVYYALDEKLVSKPVVVKVLDKVRGDEWAMRKFRQEMEALARIDHPGVVAVLDEGETPQGAPFLVMQYLDGVTLRTLIHKGGMDLARAGSILRQVGSALGAAHAKGICHRDLKPENIMVQSPDSEPCVKLIDFGIAGIRDSLFSNSDQSTRIAGTYRYMPPEQLEGKSCPESDIFAFGAIAFEMLTGEPLLHSPLDLVLMRVDGLKVKPREFRAQIPEAAECVIVKALAYKSSERYTSAREAGELLATALGSGEGDAAVTAPAAKGAQAPANSADRLEIAHVLFLDLVGFSTVKMEDQRKALETLQALVRGTAHFLEAEKAGDLIALPTGDGMALVFFGNPIPAADCALEIARAARANPVIQLRAGLHSGPVYRVADINKNRNVTGGGINIAQRVMDAGDAGHILVSATAAETLRQFGAWQERLSDLGEHAVKHGAMLHFFNLCTQDAGNCEWPSKWEKPQPVAKSRRGFLIAAIAVALAAAGGIFVALQKKPLPAKPPVAVSPARIELEYSITVKGRNGRQFQLAGEMLFPAGYEIALNLRTPQPGFLYVLDDGPLPDGSVTVNVLYPGLRKSAQFFAGGQMRIPTGDWFHIDEASGTEKLYLVWSANPVQEIESIKDLTDSVEREHIVLRDQTRLAAMRQFLAKNQILAAGIRKDEDAKRTLLSSDRPVLVHLIRLEHD